MKNGTMQSVVRLIIVISSTDAPGSKHPLEDTEEHNIYLSKSVDVELRTIC